ncbi:Uncharacterised protein [Serratia liquefaciens]|nr:Uncharacterised protein [Serratia liquefaciens]
MEYSTANGQPVTLYEFVRGDTQFFPLHQRRSGYQRRRCVWQQQAISDGGLSVGAGDSIGHLRCLPPTRGHALSRLPPSQPVRVSYSSLARRRQPGRVPHRLDRLHYRGQARGDRPHSAGHRQSGQHITRSGLRLTWGRACPYSLYDHNCKGVAGSVRRRRPGYQRTRWVSITVNLPPAPLTVGFPVVSGMAGGWRDRTARATRAEWQRCWAVRRLGRAKRWPGGGGFFQDATRTTRDL